MKYDFVIPESLARVRVDQAATTLHPSATRQAVQRWIEEGLVLLNGQPCKSKQKVRAGDRLEVVEGQEPLTQATPDDSVQFSVLFEDEHLVVVDKPPGLVVHPAAGHPTGTLVNGLLARPGFSVEAADPRDKIGHLRPGIVHRIDKDTSGILVVAKNAQAREGLKAQLQDHSMLRRYDALVVGKPHSQTISTLHGRDPQHRLRFSSKVKEGKRAITHLQLEESYCGGRVSRVSCRLETGRTHQIRVHLSQEAMTPIFADALYGGTRGLSPELALLAAQLGRQALHAGMLGFVHPLSQERLSFESEIPEDMKLAIAEFAKLQTS